MRPHTVISLVLALTPAPLWATTSCSFTTECLEGEACAETAFEVSRAAGDGESVILTTDAETLAGHMIASDDNFHFIFEAPSAAHLLTEYPNGAARYTIHMDGPFTITYHGQCEGR